MSELPQATSRRELREREAAAAAIAAAASADAKPARAAAKPARAAQAARPARAKTARRSIGRQLFSATAMLFAAALAVGVSVPASVFAPLSSAVANPSSLSSATLASQTARVSADEVVPGASARDDFVVLSWAQVLALKYAKVNNYAFTNSNGSVRWPFPYAVPISSPYGDRIAPCGGCSTYHNGVDFTPGAGAAIFAIADGVVTDRGLSGTEYGNYVIITHKIGGNTVTSTYAHMLADSSPITIGQTVHVGDFLGLVGQTGEATGPHLHFEIAVNGARTDPIPWLEANVD